MPDISIVADLVHEGVRARNRAAETFFCREADRLAVAARDLAERLGRGGKVVAVGRDHYATDAAHIEVEFVHPVLVGKRALPALDLSSHSSDALLASLRREDVLVVLGPPGGEDSWGSAARAAAARGVAVFRLPGSAGEYAFRAGSDDPFIHQELLEVLYHTLWESIHVFLESEGHGGDTQPHDGGEAAFLYPFLSGRGPNAGTVEDVALSIRSKVEEDARLRTALARDQATALAEIAEAIHRRSAEGAKVLVFGNGGSATDANDLALDLLASPKGGRSVPAISLAGSAACTSAVANDVGAAELFLRPLIAHGSPGDIAFGISTSGGSKNVIAALAEARRRGLLTVALLGHGGGEALRSGVVEHAVVVGSASIPRIQEVQASAYHLLVDLLAEHELG